MPSRQYGTPPMQVVGTLQVEPTMDKAAQQDLAQEPWEHLPTGAGKLHRNPCVQSSWKAEVTQNLAPTANITISTNRPM